MIYTYVAAFSQAEDGYNIWACIPDIKGCIATGQDLQDAISQITDTLTGFLLVYEDENMPIPTATAQGDFERVEGVVLSPITIDTSWYRDMLELIYPLANPEIKEKVIIQVKTSVE